ncbi:MAG: hypothetical protein E7001_07255 [Coriobacteriaceae bacterium]|nr:hypothetical protein [Coriobacteriaceae bacterium]
MSDDFFDDEQELMEAAAPARPAASASRPGKKGGTRTPRAAAPAGAAPVRQAPPFWMVLAIAAIALILGVVIGYLLGTQATLAELSEGTQAAAGVSVQLPEGHPELNVNEDGTASVAGSGASAE